MQKYDPVIYSGVLKSSVLVAEHLSVTMVFYNVVLPKYLEFVSLCFSGNVWMSKDWHYIRGCIYTHTHWINIDWIPMQECHSKTITINKAPT